MDAIHYPTLLPPNPMLFYVRKNTGVPLGVSGCKA